MSQKVRYRGYPPEEVPILGPEHICKREYTSYGGRHCLRGWLNTIFKCNFINESATKELQSVIGTKCIEDWNDQKDRKEGTIARAWNKTMARLGYTEGNPETP